MIHTIVIIHRTPHFVLLNQFTVKIRSPFPPSLLKDQYLKKMLLKRAKISHLIFCKTIR